MARGQYDRDLSISSVGKQPKGDVRRTARSRLGPFLLTFLMLGAAACTTSVAKVTQAASPPSPSSTAAALQTVTVCFGSMPAQWSQLTQTRATLQNIEFQALALDGDGNVFGAYKRGQEQGVAEFGARFAVIDFLPPTSGVQWMSYAKPWLVWAQGDSQTKLGIWSVHAWNSQTGEKLVLGNSQLADGTYLDNQLTFPVVGHGYVAWSTPTTRTSADLRVYRFDKHESMTLDSGHVSSPVIAGQNLVWAKFTQDPDHASFRMVDAETFKPVMLSAALTEPRPVAFLAGSKDYLAWTAWIHGTSPNGQPIATSSLTVLRLKDGRLTKYALPEGDVFHTFQFPMLAGHFMVWFTATQNAVLDLQTGKGFDIKLPSSVVGNDDEILVATNSGGGKAGGAGSTTVSDIPLSRNLSIRTCQ